MPALSFAWEMQAFFYQSKNQVLESIQIPNKVILYQALTSYFSLVK